MQPVRQVDAQGKGLQRKSMAGQGFRHQALGCLDMLIPDGQPSIPTFEAADNAVLDRFMLGNSRPSAPVLNRQIALVCPSIPG